MRIKRLEVEGFKSFANKTEILFSDNVVGVVGPNGCGKSNVVDAIRWAMGEQSAKNLRGGKMEDVIFNGTATRAAQNFASVSLTFVNQNGTFPPPYTDCSELMITRRLYRSGESEYLINKVICRLKDITDLFLGTGSSPKAYSIIEQGKVDAFVLMRPEERRNLIEEASGIAKFKNRKLSAIRKMEATQVNLTRIEDIVNEVERQRNYLKRQVQKAERFKRISEEYRVLHLKILWYRFRELEKKWVLAKSGKTQEQDQVLSIQSEAKRLESELEAVKLEILNLEEAITSSGTAIQAHKDEMHRCENAISLSEHTIHTRQEQIVERNEDIGRLRIKKNQSGETILNSETQIAEFHAQLEVANQELNQRLSVLATASNEVERLASEVSRLKSEIVTSQVLLTERTVEQGAFRDGLEGIKAQLEEAESGQRQLETKKTDFVSQRAERGRIIAQTDAELAELGTLIESAEKSVEALRKEILFLTEQRVFFKSEVEKCRLTIHQLGAIQARRESFFKERLEAIAGSELGVSAQVMTDLLEVEPGFEKPVGVALDALLKGIVVSTAKDVSVLMGSPKSPKSVADFKNVFAIKDGLPDLGMAQMNSLDADACRFIPLRSKVRTRESSVDSLMDRWLENVWYVDLDQLETITTDTLTQLSGLSGSTFVLIVNGRGDWLDSRGAVFRESSQVVAGAVVEEQHLVHVGTELVNANERFSVLETQLRAVEAELIAVQAEFDACTSRLSYHHAHYQELAANRREADRDCERLAREIDEIEKRQLESTHRVEVLQERFQSTQAKIAAAESGRNTALEQRSSLEAILKDVDARHLAALSEEEKARDLVTDTRILVASISEKRDALAQEIERSRQLKADFERNVTQYESDIQQWNSEIAQLKEKIDQLRTEIGNRTLELDHISLEWQQFRSAFEKKKLDVERLEFDLKEKQQVLDHLNSTLGEQRLLERELEVRVQNQMELIADKYRLDIRAYTPELTVEEQALLGTAKIATSEVESAIFPINKSTTTVDEWIQSTEADCDSLKAKLDNLGEVNLLAITEYQELDERFTFLSAQREDLVATLEKLRKVIDRINRITKERFLATFHAINHNFQLIFPRLFEGGKAQLFMTDESNILETGIDIVVQPPGKKSQNISLLSGGEKALTSVSLIFALFTYRPSSFCILDEVDAPLDDLNTGRYNDIVREMSKLSQFILITHNKKTMEIADVLYGVTMPENGVSQVVSVRFSEAEKFAANS